MKKRPTATESLAEIRRRYLKADAAGDYYRAGRLAEQYEFVVRVSNRGIDPFL